MQQIPETPNPLKALKILYNQGYRYLDHNGKPYKTAELDRMAEKAYRCLHAGEEVDAFALAQYAVENRAKHTSIGVLIAQIEKINVV